MCVSCPETMEEVIVINSESDEGPNVDIYHDDEFGFVDATSSGKVEYTKVLVFCTFCNLCLWLHSFQLRTSHDEVIMVLLQRE